MRGPGGGWRRIYRDTYSRLALGSLIAFFMIALGADLLASDLPIAARIGGELYIFPGLTRPPALQSFDNGTLRKTMDPRSSDWAWMPLVEYGPEQQPPILRSPPAAPDRDHWLGTDDRGRDVLARLIHGSRVSLVVGGGSVGIYILIGVILGLLGGYLGGRIDFFISRLIELGLTFPSFFLILIIMALLEQTSIWAMIVVLGITRWTDVARLVRAEVLSLKGLDFITAAQAYGASPLRIMTRHLLPNAMGPVIVNATFGIASAVLVESALSFLGFGAPPPTASWGEVLSQAVTHQHCWWLTLCPGLLIFLLITSLNILGERLRDLLDPRVLRS